MKVKAKFLDRNVIDDSVAAIAAAASVLSAVLLFVDIPSEYKTTAGITFLIGISLVHVIVWIRANLLKSIDINIEGSTVSIVTGDIFEQAGLKAIAFNEYLDTQVDNVVVSEETLNGKFIRSQLKDSVEVLDGHIANFAFDAEDVVETGVQRRAGKTTRYRLGTVCVYKDFLLTAFAKFDAKNMASLTMPEYLEFLLNFWNTVNKVYGQRSVSVAVFGSGITRIKGHKTISDEELLKIMLWTFRISEMRFKYPAKLTIVIHESKIDQINLLDIASAKNGL